MAIGDFTGQNIQDTYQRVVQTDNTNRLADGEGNIFIPISASHAITASHALFAVSASHEITFELSSSHAVSADTASFATNFTASGNISASGDIIGVTGSFDYVKTDKLQVGATGGTDILSIDGGDLQLENNKQITFADIGDGNTGRVRIVGYEDDDFIRMHVDNSNSHVLALTTTGVGIGTSSPGEKLEVVGNISASGTISASRFNGSGGDLVDVSYNNLSFVPSGIISGAAQINNLDLTINGGTF